MGDSATGDSGGAGASGAGAAKEKTGGSGRYEVKLRVYDLRFVVPRCGMRAGR